MAFVFRGPRNLDMPQVYSANNSHHENNSPGTEKIKQTMSRQQVLRILKKSHKTNHNPKPQCQSSKLQDQQFVKQLQKHEVKGSRKTNPPNHPKQQYFFKSKCKRDTQLLQNVSQEIQHDDIKLVKKSNNHNNKNKQNQRIQASKGVLKVYRQGSVGKSQGKGQERFPCLMSKEVRGFNVNTNANANLLHSKKKLKDVFAIPSIPGKEEKFGYVLKQNQLTYPQQVTKPRFEGTKRDHPGPTDYQIPESTKTKSIPKFLNPKMQLIKNPSRNQSEALINDQDALKLHNQKIKQWVQEGKDRKKIKKNSVHVKVKEMCDTRDLSVCSDQSGETVYQYDSTPGPGYYSYSSVKDKKDFRSKNQKFSKIFLNKSQRFEDIPLKNNGYQNLMSYSNNPSIGSSLHNHKTNFFISRLERNIKIQNDSIAPAPGHYNIRKSMENDIIAKIIKNSPNLFNNNLPRLANTVVSITPGPGSYKLDIPCFKVQSFRVDNNIDQKDAASFSLFKACQNILVQNMSKNNQTEIIHQLKDCVIEQSRSPPFLSSSPRDLNLNPKVNYITEPAQLQTLSPSRKHKQNIVPFNSSEQKGKQFQKNNGTEIGLYQNSSSWDKKSFSVLFN